MKKGARVRVARGRKSQGVEGTVFWEGPNKFGEGTRLGIKDAGGETHWISAEHVELLDAPEGEDAAEPAAPAGPAGPAPDAGLLQKGARVGWDGGAGTIFWVGQNKFGPGLRLGVTGDDEQKHWVDAAEVQVLEEAEGDGAAGGGASDGGGGGEVIGALPDEGVVFDRDDEDDGRHDLEEDGDVPF